MCKNLRTDRCGTFFSPRLYEHKWGYGKLRTLHCFIKKHTLSVQLFSFQVEWFDTFGSLYPFKSNFKIYSPCVHHWSHGTYTTHQITGSETLKHTNLQHLFSSARKENVRHEYSYGTWSAVVWHLFFLPFFPKSSTFGFDFSRVVLYLKETYVQQQQPSSPNVKVHCDIQYSTQKSTFLLLCCV